jgi:Ca2+-binding RTX toxin-like protein
MTTRRRPSPRPPSDRLAAIALAALAPLAAPAAAHATTTVSYSPTTGLLVQGDDASEHASLAFPEGRFTVNPIGGIAPAQLVPGAGCDPGPFSSVICAPPSVASRAVTANLRGGDDDLLGSQLPEGDMVVEGGSGSDRIFTGGGNDNIRGQAGNDELDGFGGNDDLAGEGGNDVLEGGAGNDRFRGDGISFDPNLVAGTDTMRGEAGRDTLQASTGAHPDLFDGGPGTDTADYRFRNQPLTLGIIIPGGSDPINGQANEGDDLDNVERLVGATASDVLTVERSSGAIGRLFGAGGPDMLRADGLGAALDGGSGSDSILGSQGGDAIDAREPAPPALADDINCRGGNDLLAIDLEDPPTPPGCEQIRQFALDDGPPGQALKQRLRVRPGARVAVKVACPRRARTGCRGVLTLRDPKSRRVLARGRYRVGLGKKDSVSLRARRRLPRRVVAHMREQGVSKKGPRFSSRLLRVIR